MPAASEAKPAEKKRKLRSWAPRFWMGCDTFAWLRMMSKGRFAWHPPQYYIGACTFFVSLIHTSLRWAQHGLYGRDIAQTQIKHAPVFIIGHWRTGTTLLHELLILDPRHTYPNTYQCMEPNHFLLTEAITRRYLGFLMPERRPMDNMPAGWERPQEDEFALCMMGQPSPYLTIAFPNRPPIDTKALDLEGLTPAQLKSWKKAFHRFLQTLTFNDPRRLVLKSPPHSCRIPTLLEMFPDARFIHIVRNPYKVFPSTVKLWRSLYERHGMQTPNYVGLEERVFETFTHLYDKLEEGKRHVHPSRFYEVKYEDLTANPLGELQAMYRHLELGDFEPLRGPAEKYLAENSHYETNKLTLSEETRAEITRRWGRIIERYDYELDGANEDATILPMTAAQAG